MVNKIEISTVSKTIDEIDDYRNTEVDLDHALNVAGKTLTDSKNDPVFLLLLGLHNWYLSV